MMAFAPCRVSAQGQATSNAIVPDNGGRLGVAVDGQSYSLRDIIATKVTGLTDKSPMNRILHVGDYIYRINDTQIKTAQDALNAVTALKPSSEVTVYWIDATNNFNLRRTDTYTLDVNAVPITQLLSCAPNINLAAETGDSINRMRTICTLFAGMERESATYSDLLRKYKPQFIGRINADRLTLRESHTSKEFFDSAMLFNRHYREAADWVASLPCSNCNPRPR